MWDTILQNFGSDCEYYRNMRMAGYESIITDLPVKHHGGQTTKSEPYRQRVYHSAIKLYWAYYKEKWGGYPSEEIYDRPFNR
jgi:hypothetical protein